MKWLPMFGACRPATLLVDTKLINALIRQMRQIRQGAKFVKGPNSPKRTNIIFAKNNEYYIN